MKVDIYLFDLSTYTISDMIVTAIVDIDGVEGKKLGPPRGKTALHRVKQD